MAKKPRDYKAEYRRTKERIRAKGYESEREYKRIRKELSLPKRAPAPDKSELQRERPSLFAQRERSILPRLRRESKAWSNAHSHTGSSRYSDSMSDDEVRRYHRAFVERIETGSRRGKAREKRRRIREWIVPAFLDQQEWEQNYGPV
jgi:hypothetical protein